MKFIREMIHVLLENWTIKLTALILAFVLWAVVRGEPGAERVITAPLEVTIPANMQITNDRPNSVDVTVRGLNPWFVQTIPSCIVNLQTAGEGEHIVPLTPENIRVPRSPGIEIVGIRPARIVVDLERVVAKQVSVSIAVRGDTAPGYDVYNKSVTPSKVLISGPRSHVAGIAEISTEAVPLTGRTAPFRTAVNLNVKDTIVHTTPAGPVLVDIEIGVHRRTVLIRKVPIAADEPGFSVTPRWVSVTVLVPDNFQGKLDAQDFTATAVVRGLASPINAAKVKPDIKCTVQLDPAIVVTEVQPAEVIVRKMGM
jgi:YbbR domain-containing protein